MSELKSLLRSQTALQNQLLSSQSNFKKTPKDRFSWNYIQTKLELLEKYFTTYHENHLQILQHEEFEDSQYFDMYFETEDLYATTKEIMMSKQREYKKISIEMPTTSHKQNINLPPLQIPTFNGQYNDWLSFHDQFSSLVHSNNSLSNVTKLQLLKQNLIGEAAVLLKNIAVTENNYEHAWEKLKKRYSNKRVIVNSYLTKLMTMRSITSESASAIKNLLDTSTDCLGGLQGIGINIKTWDPILIYIITSKLDNESIRHWEEIVNKDLNEDLPTYKQLSDFLEMRFRSLEGVLSTKRAVPNNITTKKIFYTRPKEVCVVCNGEHYIYKCKKFAQLSIIDRKRFIEQNNLCFNCLIPNHGVKTCKQNSRCRICGKRHHSLIHTEIDKTPPEINNRQDIPHREQISESTQLQHAENTHRLTHHAAEISTHYTTNVLLATALVKAVSHTGRTITLRALIDQGSEGSFITENATQLLGLKKTTINGTISGLGRQVLTKTNSSVNLTISSHHDKSLQLPVNAYVLTSLTTLLPSRQVDITWKHLQGLTLADPEFHKPAKIDLLLGAEVYCKIILDGIITGSVGSPLAQKTRLGWILSGEICTKNNLNHIISMHITTQSEDLENLQRFWELESEDSYKNTRNLTEEELLCTQIYEDTHTRDMDGRYVVELPFKDKTFDFGDTKQIALKRLEQLEARLNRNENLKQEYTKVLMEYLSLNHMEEVDMEELDTKKKFYMPHHAVLRPDKSTTKLRIVFDASCKGPNGKSLNDNLLIGPKVQQDLKHIVMRWRKHEVVFTADCVKMFRQIKVTKESANYQRILWRINGVIKEYRLNRVTFGTASAPFLATKTIQQLAIDEEKNFPEASDSTEEALHLYDQITNLMKAGGFELQRWTTNKSEESIDSNYLQLQSDEIIKILGIKWNKTSDTFHYDIKQTSSEKYVTKRLILSEISRLFDPLGWLAPVIVNAKIMIQKLWLAKVSWDEEVPKALKTEWLKFRSDLEETKDINIKRWYNINSTDQGLELHGYSDASQMAYAAVVYIRIIKNNGEILTQLVTAKTRVAPIKTISVPRLELCGAVLLTKLLKEVSDVLKISQNNIKAYTDSNIVLAWIQSHPSKWKTFVANRTSEILSILPDITWSYVESKNNPADIASRGALPKCLHQNILWWSGPSDLLKKEIINKILKNNSTNLEMKKEKIKVMTNQFTEEFDILKRYSSLTKLLRVTAYILRIFNKVKVKEKHLSGLEINKARETCIKLCQMEVYREEMDRLKNEKKLRRDSKILSLNPFLDEKGILRIGGRLQGSHLPDYTKHQIILPEKHHFSKLLLTDFHEKTLHGGPMLMLSNLRRKYWIIHAKSLTNQIVKKCTICARYRASTKTQIMGSLPEQRVTPCKPFLRSGVDFAGPVELRLSKGRGCKTQKGYIAIFICLVTRAIHIEIVTSLSAQDFVAAFKRFVARRGHCSDIWSDNATNFIAGNKELKSLLLNSQSGMTDEVKNLLANDGTTWHHIPPSAPHFGGLWEAGVKSIKFHLKRVLGNTTLTYEEMSTVVVQIEACLNSRPISPMSNDPSDLLPLTPGHFLIGEAPIVVPETNYLDTNISTLSRWQITQKITQDFWRRWSAEYLSRLQQRPKWMSKTDNVKVGDLVLLKEDNLPPSKWNLARIIDVHPGKDNFVRVVSVKSKNTVLKRPVTKICLLPVDQ